MLGLPNHSYSHGTINNVNNLSLNSKKSMKLKTLIMFYGHMAMTGLSVILMVWKMLINTRQHSVGRLPQVSIHNSQFIFKDLSHRLQCEVLSRHGWPIPPFDRPPYLFHEENMEYI
ncbi:uncharacterized protein ZBIST_4393 [Zygosaccharomyces bailii]|nr:uncharacterized protein ZBIST_4393 [Zygosaccharomyces bailii]